MLVTLVTVSATISIPVFWRGGHLVMGGGRLHVREVVACGGLKNQAILNRRHVQGWKKDLLKRYLPRASHSLIKS